MERFPHRDSDFFWDKSIPGPIHPWKETTFCFLVVFDAKVVENFRPWKASKYIGPNLTCNELESLEFLQFFFPLEDF